MIDEQKRRVHVMKSRKVKGLVNVAIMALAALTLVALGAFAQVAFAGVGAG